MKIKTTIDIEIKDIIDLICTGAEGGMCSSWLRDMTGSYPLDADLSEIPKDMRDYPAYHAPFVEGGAIICVVEGVEKDQKDVEVRVDLAAVEKAMQLMATEDPKHFGDFTNDNSDAITGDVFLQLAVYGKVIFG